MAKKSFLNKLLGRDKKGLSGMTITITQDGGSSDPVSSGGATTAGGADVNAIPLIGSLPAKVQYWIAGGTLLVSLVVAAGMSIVAERQKSFYGQHIVSITSLKNNLVALQQNATRLASGLDTFAPIAYLEQKYVEDGFIYMRSTIFSDQKELTGKQRDELDGAWDEWSRLRAARDQVTAAHIAVLTVRSKFAGSKAGVAAASTMFNNVVAAKDSVDEDTLAGATKAMASLNRIKARIDNGDSNVSFGASAKEADDFFAQLSPILERLNSDGVKDANLKKSMDDSLKFLRAFVPSARKINALLIDMTEIRARAQELSDGSGRVLQLADNVDAGLHDQAAFYEKFNWFITAFAILGLMAIILLAMINNNEGKKRTYEAKNENEANQRAIMSLLDEIANLADGDLTVRATVTEEITGAIADSVNFAIGEMGGLVTSIKTASTQISDAVNTATSNSTQLLEINSKQSRDITETGKSVLSITSAIEQVSKRMEDSKRVAQSSVESSEKGMQAVNTSIEGIKSIRENVEETGKRIKRLTEQSIQISEIVELIGDISERTSVLAINATVQATKAGAAGKGFKVVADAVQELANQASDATRRIGALINAIQTDIQGAGVAMQKTTEEAVRGAALAETTGEVLAEINDVSLALADIVAEVNEQIGTSARSATDVSMTMKRVLESVVDSTDATKATGEAVEAINKLTEQLRESVSGFQL